MHLKENWRITIFKRYLRYGRKDMKKENKSLTFAWFLIRMDFWRIVSVSIVFFLLLSLGIIPILDKIFAEVLKLVGYSYLTSEVMLQFFLSPWMLGIVMLLLPILGIGLLWIQSFITIQYVYLKEKRKESIVTIIVAAIREVVAIFHFNRFRLVFFNIILAVFWNIPFLFWIGLKLRMPRYAISYCLKLNEFKIAAFIVLFVLFINCFFHMFTMHYCILDRKNYKEARRASRTLLKGRRVQTLKGFLLWNTSLIIIMFIGYLLVITMVSIIILLFVPDHMKVLLFRTICDQININMVGFLGIAGITFNLAYVTILFLQYKGQEEADPLKARNSELELGKENNKYIYKGRILIALACLLSVNIILTYDTISNGSYGSFRSFEPAKVTAHRGSSLEAPENTLEAVGLAIQSMADYVEIDVQGTKDRKVVLMHDYKMDRTTGMSGSVSDYTYEQLSKMDAGNWFHKRYAKTAIPKLQQVIKLTKGKIMLNIELKPSKDTPHLEEDVVQLIEEYDLIKQCVVTSIFEESLEKVKKLNENIKTGHVIVSAYGDYFHSQYADFFSITSSFVSESVVRKAHKLGKEIHVWTVNTEKETNRMLQLGVDNIITDMPVLVKSYLYNPIEEDTLIDYISLALK